MKTDTVFMSSMWGHVELYKEKTSWDSMAVGQVLQKLIHGSKLTPAVFIVIYLSTGFFSDFFFHHIRPKPHQRFDQIIIHTQNFNNVGYNHDNI